MSAGLFKKDKFMKERLINFIKNQVNLILELGKEDLLPSEYLAVLINNIELISNLYTNDKTQNKENELKNSLSVIVSNFK